MDLSSLEGPPIPDPRFTVPSRRSNIPSIQLDMTTPLSPVSPLTPRDLPPRPSSTDAIFRPRSQYTYRPLEPEDEPPRCQRCHSLQPPTVTDEPDNNNQQQLTPYPTLNLPPPPPSSSFTLHPAPRSRSVSDITPHQSFYPMLSTTTTTTVTTTQAVTTTTTTQGNRLVWLESEKLWLLKPLPSESSSPSFLTDMAPSLTPNTQYPPYHPSTVRSDFQFTSTEIHDIPPPYERHIYDRPLPPLPADNRSRGGLYGSRWTAVARRRANRSVLG
ncbi:uncharacterized protein BO80DRAFT_96279 [Aspergillus ibericus CBS 121593]|uniref:Uncharacterized protein n=1 Tax=Aspergillus ibericus CBS 121593 TaxID=1448316 RepID=A0A395GYR6_9EURO|nr:hypothetical protein BO80DRAFT_96279 [Aspergillus ibericus CBS 121593]RAL00727.1 hypothetical protein BO80DRAFT_96279 [Aspergillus ibericus CBS 121593]